jgi:hypothetical protein
MVIPIVFGLHACRHPISVRRAPDRRPTMTEGEVIARGGVSRLSAVFASAD